MFDLTGLLSLNNHLSHEILKNHVNEIYVLFALSIEQLLCRIN